MSHFLRVLGVNFKRVFVFLVANGFPDIRVKTRRNPFLKLLPNAKHGVSEINFLWELAIVGFDVSLSG